MILSFNKIIEALEEKIDVGLDIIFLKAVVDDCVSMLIEAMIIFSKKVLDAEQNMNILIGYITDQERRVSNIEEQRLNITHSEPTANGRY